MMVPLIMAGSRSGCRAIVQQKAPLAVYHHCAAHRLNLSVLSACKIVAFRNTEYFIGEIARFFHFFLQKGNVSLIKLLMQYAPQLMQRNLKTLAKHGGFSTLIPIATVFLELLPVIHTTLLAMVSPADFEQTGTGIEKQ